MKLPNNVQFNDVQTLINEIESKKEIVIQADETEKEPMYTINPDEDEKYEVSFNKYIEKLIRTSAEYKRYIGILKNDFDLTSCKVLDKVDIKDVKKVGFEFHHYPATLYDIVYAVRETFREDPEKSTLAPYKSFEIANYVMKLHYEGKVGLVPLTKTAHELAHNGHIFIPLSKNYVFGNYKEMIEEHNFSTDFMNNYNNIVELSKHEDKIRTNKFDYKSVKIEMTSAVQPNMISLDTEEDKETQSELLA